MKRNRFANSTLLILCLCLLAPLWLYAQEKELKVTAENERAPIEAIKARLNDALGKPLEALDLELIMEGENFFGAQPRDLRWDGDSSRLWFSWKQWDQEERATWQYTIASGELVALSEDQAELVPGSRALWNDSRTKAFWSLHDSVLVYDVASKNTSVLLSHLAGARVLTLNEDESALILMYSSNLVAIALNGQQPAVAVLTDIRKGSEKKQGPKTDSQKWQEKQQLALFDVLAKKHDRNEKAEARSKKFKLTPFYLNGWQLRGLFPSRDLEYAVVILRKDTPLNRTAEMPSYVTESGYTEIRAVRDKVGDATDSLKAMMLHIPSGVASDIDFGLEDRKVSIFAAQWSPDYKRAMIMPRAADNKDRWFAVITPAFNAESKLVAEANIVFTEHDDAWISWNVARGNGWLPDGSGIYFISEKDGLRHLYAVAKEGGEAIALTSGNFTVDSPALTNDEKFFVFAASLPGNPHEKQTFMLPVAGGEMRQLTTGSGRSNGILSPSGSMIATIASSSAKPWELFVNTSLDDTLGKQITDSPSPAYKSWNWTKPELIYFEASDGVKVPAQVYKPSTPHPNKPGIVFVHGAGYMQNVHHWWRGASYGRVYCFHHLLADMGYTVIDIDYRGSAGYGRDWRTAIYQHMGGKDFTDQVDGAKVLVDKYGVDPERIGLYGGSYGGFMTLMCMFNAPDVFAAGAAMRPVTDWAAYNQGYTSNILNTPQDDPDAYIKSSPIYFAEGLKGALLICHGIVDDNVHFQGAVRLAQRLIELRKENWEFAMYPVERHGFVESASWVDEYRRIVKLFNDNLMNK